MLKIDNKLVCDQYLSGKSLTQLKKLFNCSQDPIERILKKNNIKIRPKYYWNRKYHDKHTLIFDYFDNIDTNEKAYWLGYLTADGTISKNNYKASLSSKDLEIIEKFKKCINTTHPISTVKSYVPSRQLSSSPVASVKESHQASVPGSP